VSVFCHLNDHLASWLSFASVVELSLSQIAFDSSVQLSHWCGTQHIVFAYFPIGIPLPFFVEEFTLLQIHQNVRTQKPSPPIIFKPSKLWNFPKICRVSFLMASFGGLHCLPRYNSNTPIVRISNWEHMHLETHARTYHHHPPQEQYDQHAMHSLLMDPALTAPTCCWQVNIFAT